MNGIKEELKKELNHRLEWNNRLNKELNSDEEECIVKDIKRSENIFKGGIL